MKTNVSIKFNSIEEYQEIEKVLEDMRYVLKPLKCAKDNKIGEVLIHPLGGEFTRLYFTFSIKTYDSLQEYLEDNKS